MIHFLTDIIPQYLQKPKLYKFNAAEELKLEDIDSRITPTMDQIET